MKVQEKRVKTVRQSGAESDTGYSVYLYGDCDLQQAAE